MDFWAEWCGPCRMMGPILESVAKKLSGKLKVSKLNVDDNPKTASQYQVRGIPTMILFKDGKEVDRAVGYMPENNLVDFLSKHLEG